MNYLKTTKVATLFTLIYYSGLGYNSPCLLKLFDNDLTFSNIFGSTIKQSVVEEEAYEAMNYQKKYYNIVIRKISKWDNCIVMLHGCNKTIFKREG